MNRKAQVQNLVIALFLVITGYACTEQYADEKVNDLVMGLYFGMDKDTFFQHCWDLNQNGLASHGTMNNNVMYEDSVNFDSKVVVNFYPRFVDDKISELPIRFYYKGWAPWNKHELPQDSLQMQVVRWLEQKYDTNFEVKEINENTKAYYKVMGPITVGVYNDNDDMIVHADIKHKGFQK